MDNKLSILIKGKLDISDLSQAKIDQQLKNLRINLKSTLDLSQQSIAKFKQDIEKLSKSVKINLKVTVDNASISNAQRTIQTNMSRLTNANRNSGSNILNAQDIENQVKRINNSLDRLKINKDKVFSDTRVSSEVARLRDMENAFRRGEISARQYGLQLDTLRTRVAQVSGEFRNSNRDGYAFSQMLTLAAKKIAIWGISTNLVYGSLNQLKNGISYISELDNALNQVRIVTGKTQVEVEKLAQTYNKLGKEMSVSTREIASTSADLYRQGLSDSDVEDRMKSIIQYAKISSISLKESNTIITATANATGESVNKIIDIFALLGDTTASGADEIGEALQRVASASESSNISLEKSASWLATISSITRESASTIGRSLNSAISRYESIKSTGFNSEDSTKLNDVVESLSDIGIKATDSQGQLLDFANVMDMVGARFDTLSKNEKAYITTTMFGTFQRNRGLTLLNNYADSLKNYENALNASGTSEQKFAIYQESTSARLDRLKASWESFWQSSLDSGVIKGLIDATATLIDAFGNLSTIIMSVVTVLALWKGTAITSTIMAWVTSTKTLNIALADNIRYMIIAKGEALGWTTAQVNAAIATNGLKLALNGLKVAFLSNPIGIIAVVLTTAIGLFDIFSSRIDSASQKQKQVVDDLTQSINKLKAETKEIPNLISTYEELSKVTLKTAEQKDKLSTATAKLSSLFEGSVTGFTAEGQAAELDIAYIKQLTEQKERLLETQQKSLATTFDVSGTDSLKKLQDNQKEMDSLNKKLESYKINMDKMSSGETPSLNREKGIQDYKDLIDGVAKQKAILEATIQSETATFVTGAIAVDQLSDSTNKLSKSMQNDLTSSVIKAKGSMSDFTSTTIALKSINITKTISDITAHMNAMSEEGKSTVEIQDYLKNSLGGVGEQLTKLGVPIPIVTELIKQLNNDFTLPEVKKAEEKVSDFSSSLKTLQETMSKSASTISEVQSALKEYDDNGKFNIDTIVKLSEKHKQLLSMLGDEKGLHEELTNIIQEEQEVSRKAYAQMLMDSEEFYTAKVLGNAQVMDALSKLYNGDLSQYKSLAEAKAKVDEELIKNLASLWANYYKAGALVAQPLDGGRTVVDANGNEQSITPEMKAQYSKLKEYSDQMSKIAKSMDNIALKGTSGIDFSSIGMGSKEKDKKEPTSSLAEQVDIEESLIRSFQTQVKQTIEQGKLLEKQLATAKSAKDYNAILSITNDLIENQKLQIIQLGEAKDKVEKEFAKVSTQSGFQNTSQWIDPNGEATLYYQEQWNASSVKTQKQMSATFDKLSKLQKAWTDNTTAINTTIEAQNALTQQSKEDLIKSLEEQSALLSSKETATLESSFQNLDIESWIKKNVSATKTWAETISELQEELSKLGNPTTLEGQKKFNELMIQSAKLAADAKKAEDEYAKSVDKMRQEKLFESTDQNLQEIMSKIDAVDQQQQLSKGGISSAVPKIDMEIVPRIDYKSVEEAIAEIPKPNEDIYDFKPPTTFVDFIHNEFTNAVSLANTTISDLKSKITALGEVTPENKDQILSYYQQIQNQVQTLSNVAKNAQDSLKLKLDTGEISQDDFNNKMQAIQTASIEVLAIPKIEITAEATQGIQTLQDQMKDIVVDADTKLADDKLLALISKQYETIITINADDIAATQSILMLQQPTSSIHTIYVQTVEGEKPEGYAKGTKNHPGGLAIVDDEANGKRELIVLPNGSIMLGDNSGPKLVNLPKGTQVIPNDETERILKSNNGKIPAYADGTGSHITDIDFLNDSLDEFAQSISDVSKEIAKTTKIVAKDNTAVEKSDKKIAGYEKTLSKYLNEDGTYKDKYVGSRSAERAVDRTQKNIEKETTKNEQLVTKAESDQAILDGQKASKTDFTQKLIATQKALANLNSAQYIEQKINLYQEAITVASANIDELYDSIKKYKNEDSEGNITYDDNEQTREVLGKIKSNFEAQKSAQLSIKQLVKERFEAEYEGFDKAQAKAEAQVSYLQKTLEYQKLIGASIEEQLATEQAIQEENQTKVDSLQAEKTQLEADLAEAEASVKADLAKVDPNYTETDLANALANSQEFNQASDKLSDVNSDLIDANIAIKQTANEIANIKFDNLVKPFKDAISDLQVLLQLLDETDFAGSIANIEAQMAQEASIIASIKQQIAETLADTSLTAGEKATKVSDLTTQLNEAELAMKGLINSEKEFQNKQLAKTFEDQYEAIEKTLFNGSTEQEARDALNQRIALQEKYLSGAEKDLEVSKIRAQIQSEGLTLTAEQNALLNSQGDIEKSSIERLQKQLDIQQLQLKVKNLMDQKTIQQMTQNADGTWDFTYVADQEAIASAQEELANSQVDLINWEQDEINKADQEKLDEKSKYLARVKTIMDRALNGEYASFEDFQRDMTNLNREYMGDMNLINSTEWNNIFASTQSNLDNIESAYSIYVTNMEALAVRAQQALQEILIAQTAEAKAKEEAANAQAASQASAQSAQENRANSSYESQTAEMNANNANGSVPTVNVNKVWNVGYSSAQSGTPDVKVTDSQGNVVPVTVTQTNGSNFAVTPVNSYQEGQTYTIVAGGTVQEFKASKTGSYKDGGVVDYSGNSIVHGSPSSSEVYFNSGQAKKLYELVKGLPEGLDITKIMNNSVLAVRNMSDVFRPMDIMKNISGVLKQSSQTVQQNFNIDNISFPNVLDASGIEDAFKSLPLLAAQKAKVQYGQ